MKAIKWTYQGNPFYTHFKKHFCPRCGTKVKLGYDRKIIYRDSIIEARNYDFSDLDTNWLNSVDFRTRCFFCPNCEINISFKVMKEYEEKRYQFQRKGRG
ncbi:MAG: hypothetical protein HDR19_04725 [Lachnospiraceae bacterium]|nr:hypothetical protein [Lachnospiraceae bacterium]